MNSKVKTNKKTKPLKIEKVQAFHIDNPIYINKSAKGILDQVNKLRQTYEFNKHGKRPLEKCRLRPEHFKRLVSSINSSLKKNEKRCIETDLLIWKELHIISI